MEGIKNGTISPIINTIGNIDDLDFENADSDPNGNSEMTSTESESEDESEKPTEARRVADFELLDVSYKYAYYGLQTIAEQNLSIEIKEIAMIELGGISLYRVVYSNKSGDHMQLFDVSQVFGVRFINEGDEIYSGAVQKFDYILNGTEQEKEFVKKEVGDYMILDPTVLQPFFD